MHRSSKKPSVALVYDHLITEYGGAEQVLQTLLAAFPDAPLFTTLFDAKKVTWIDSRRVITAPIPGFFRQILGHRVVLDLCAPLLLEQHNFSQYSVVISVTTTAAKGILTTPDQLHLCYLLSPPRYLYHQAHELQTRNNWQQWPILKQLTQFALSYLRWWDQVAATRPDTIVTLSEIVAGRIRQTYGRSVSQIIYPPLTLPLPASTSKKISQKMSFFLVLSRLVSYKRIDLAVAAALKTGELLCIAGTGAELKQLQLQAGSAGITRTEQTVNQIINQAVKEDKHIIFLGNVSPEEKLELLEQAQALIMPGVEDFGLTAAESVISGTPVIIHTLSGVSELLTQQESVLLSEQSVSAVEAALQAVRTCTVSSARRRELYQELNSDQFVRKFHNLIFQINTSRARMSSNREDL